MHLETRCEESWLQANWDASFVLKTRPSIEYLELFAVTAAVLAWAGRYKDRRMVRLFCDNQSVCHMLNASSSSCKYCMVLIRLIVLTGLENNVRFFAKYVESKCNGRADALSRGEFRRFWKLSPPNMDYIATQVPQQIWPMSKVWPW